MSSIELLDTVAAYRNPIPHLVSRHAYFPGLVRLPSAELLALFALGEAMDAANVTTVVSRSTDGGRTWALQGPLHAKEPHRRFHSDYLKPTLLSDGTLVATGYRFHRNAAEEEVSNPQTDGVRGGDNLVSFSEDQGHTWTTPSIIPTSRPELIETSGPAIQLSGGDLLSAGSVYPTWNGTHPSGHVGVTLRSRDRGRTWCDERLFFHDPAGQYLPLETRLCEMQPGRVVALFWMAAPKTGRNLPNHLAVSHDNGATWSAPIDTRVAAQASNLLYLGGDRLLTIHSHREGQTGLFVRLVDFRGDAWRVLDETDIWNKASARRIASFTSMSQNLRFGQPSLVPLGGGEFLAAHWAVEDGLGCILAHRLKVGKRP